jgi:apolipoprotein N-acyltransferase
MLMPQATTADTSPFRAAVRSPAGLSLLSCVLLWAAFPPLGLSLLAWIAPLGWLRVIDRQPAPGRVGYFWMWVTGCLFWLAILHGIRLAFWALIFGWIALSLYLAIYIPLFVGVARILRHRWHWPLVASAPVAWTGLELVRSYLLTGYAASTLAHSQYQQPLAIQLADQLGGYGISFIIMAAAVAVYRLCESALTRRRPRSGCDLAVAAALLLALFGYGAWRLEEGERLASGSPPLLRVALIQENTPSVFDSDRQRLHEAWRRYAEVTSDAVRIEGLPDLIVWPESTFNATISWMEDRTVSRVPQEAAENGYDRQALRELVAERRELFRNKVAALLEIVRGSQPSQSLRTTDDSQRPYYLLGDDAAIFEDDRIDHYNAAFLLDPQGNISGRYDKVHLVMFGEYIPLGWALSFLCDAFGLSSATPGTEAQCFEVAGVRVAPSICFESMLPQVMAWQMRSLAARRQSPDVLVSITNDSWFRGSTMLDHHLACEVLAAVEMRRPFLVAANTGLSAWIEGTGRIKQVSPRSQPQYILAEPTRDSRWGLTQLWGDAPAWCLAAVCAVALTSEIVRRRRKQHE